MPIWLGRMRQEGKQKVLGPLSMLEYLCMPVRVNVSRALSISPLCSFSLCHTLTVTLSRVWCGVVHSSSSQISLSVTILSNISSSHSPKISHFHVVLHRMEQPSLISHVANLLFTSFTPGKGGQLHFALFLRLSHRHLCCFLCLCPLVRE